LPRLGRPTPSSCPLSSKHYREPDCCDRPDLIDLALRRSGRAPDPGRKSQRAKNPPAGQPDSRQPILIVRAGARTITTSGLELIPFAFEPLQLVAGNSYHIQFSFNGPGNQNFFHNNCASFQADDPNTCIGGQVRYSVGPFANIDGTAGGQTRNFVQPEVMVEVAEVAPVPEPATIVLFATGLALAGSRRLRTRQHRARQSALPESRP